MKLSDLKKNPANPRVIKDAKFALLKKSIEEFPAMMALRPIVVDQDFMVLGGNMRLEALRALKFTDVPEEWIKQASELSEEQKREFIVKDNSGFGEWDMAALAAEWRDLPLAEWGMDVPDEWGPTEPPVVEDEAAAAGMIDRAGELQKKWQVKRGDLWQIGEHRLLCGDATSAEDVQRLMDGQRAALCFTSPPYGQQRDYGAKNSDWLGLMKGVCSQLPLTEDGQLLVNLGLTYQAGEVATYWDEWLAWMRHDGWRFFGWYVWDQGAGLPGNWSGRFAPSHEFIFHLNHATRAVNKTKDCQNAGKRRSGPGLRNQDGSQTVWNDGNKPVQEHKIPDSVVRVHRHNGSGVEVAHPAVFSVAFAVEIQSAFSDPGALLYEPFAGAGTSLVAAYQLERVCYGLELEPSYVAVCLQRLSDLGLHPQMQK